jgi:hypothetical protein
MSMIELTPAQSHPISGPNCVKCAGPTRLIGIEPHPTRPHTDLRTFECMACDAVQAKVIPFAH